MDIRATTQYPPLKSCFSFLNCLFFSYMFHSRFRTFYTCFCPWRVPLALTLPALQRESRSFCPLTFSPGGSAVRNEGTQLGAPERPLCCRAGEEWLLPTCRMGSSRCSFFYQTVNRCGPPMRQSNMCSGELDPLWQKAVFIKTSYLSICLLHIVYFNSP